jgi:hypothetical protein
MKFHFQVVLNPSFACLTTTPPLRLPAQALVCLTLSISSDLQINPVNCLPKQISLLGRGIFERIEVRKKLLSSLAAQPDQLFNGLRFIDQI